MTLYGLPGLYELKCEHANVLSNGRDTRVVINWTDLLLCDSVGCAHDMCSSRAPSRLGGSVRGLNLLSRC